MNAKVVPALVFALALVVALPATGGDATVAPPTPEPERSGIGCPFSGGQDRAAVGCPYLDGTARACPRAGGEADTGGCPYSGSSGRAPGANERPAGETAGRGCPFLNGERPAVDPVRERNRA